MKKQKCCKPEAVFPTRRVWVVEESKLALGTDRVPETFGYNDWEIYHGA